MSKNKLKSSTRRNFLLAFFGCFLISCNETNNKRGESEREIILGNVDSFTSAYNLNSLYRVAIIVENLRTARSFKAISLVCPHQSCIVGKTEDNKFRCPCHGAIFGENGKIISGPTKKNLEWKRLSIKNSQLILFPDQNVSEDTSLTIPN